MKKLALFSIATLMLTAVSSCDSSETEQTMSFNVPCINIVTYLNDNTTLASYGYYNFELNITQMVGNISASGLIVDNSSMDFSTNDYPYESSGYNAFFKNVSATVMGNSTYTISNGTFLFTPHFWYPQEYVGQKQSTYDIIANYNIGNLYSVKTYPIDAVYSGTTNTSYTIQGIEQTAQNVNIYYQVVINPTEKLANIVMYNAKFSDSPNEPTKAAIYVKNLPVVFSSTGMTISGEDVIPEVLDGSTTTPNERYVFNTINFKTTDANLTQCEISYEVAGMYYGNFSGNYIQNEGETKYEPYLPF